MRMSRDLRRAPAWGRCLAAVLLALALPTSAQVYKCVDKAGRISYQQLPCPEALKSTRMDIQRDWGSVQGDGDDAEWSTRVKRKEVIVGMPRAYVIQAYGNPQQMRPGRAAEKAAEVWLYRRSDLNTAVGFNKGVVAWMNLDLQDGPAAPPDTGASVRQNFNVGRRCAELVSEAGAPTTTFEELDEGMAKRVMRQIWEPAPGDRERTVVSCLDGVVARVDRTPNP
ncbi:MAG: DUF4124 domain-containing protein [Casimicrobiaceae bacterium]